jgi:hypothetical protein
VYFIEAFLDDEKLQGKVREQRLCREQIALHSNNQNHRRKMEYTTLYSCTDSQFNYA